MGAYTTLRITRGKAMELLTKSMFGEHESRMDGVLERFMEDRLAASIRNCLIVPDDCDDNNDDEV